MHFVNNIYFVLAHRRRVHDFFDQTAHIFDAALAGRVDLDDVVQAVLFREPAVAALAAGLPILRGQAVERFRHELCAGRLPRAARTGKQIRMAILPDFNSFFKVDVM